MNSSFDQIQAICRPWPLETDRKERAELDALFWKTLCEYLLNQPDRHEQRATQGLTPADSGLEPSVQYASPDLQVEWTREGI